MTTALKTVTTYPSAISKKTVQFALKSTTNSPTKTVTLIQNSTPTINDIGAQDDDQMIIK